MVLEMTKIFEDDRQKTLDLLADERAILRAGDFHKLADLLKSKSQILEYLKESSVNDPNNDPKDWKVVQQTLKRNQNLIQASLDGIRQATQTLQALDQIQDCLTTYNLKGRLQTVPTDTGSKLEKQA